MKKSTLTKIQVFFWIATFFYFCNAYGYLGAFVQARATDSPIAFAEFTHSIGTFFIVVGISTAVHAVCKYYKEKGSN